MLLRIHAVLTITLVASVYRTPTNKPKIDPDSEGENIFLHWDPAVHPGQGLFHLKQLKSHLQSCQKLHLKRLWWVGGFSLCKTWREIRLLFMVRYSHDCSSSQVSWKILTARRSCSLKLCKQENLHPGGGQLQMRWSGGGFRTGAARRWPIPTVKKTTVLQDLRQSTWAGF